MKAADLNSPGRPKVLVQGEVFTDYPKDFYIPPDYLEVLLEDFEGPLDLLLYIIRKHHFDIAHLPVAEITEQYLRYLHLHKQRNQELALEYLVMASTLIALKARLLLPQKIDNEGSDCEEADPRFDLQKRLEAYARAQELAQHLDRQERLGRDFDFVMPLETDEARGLYIVQPSLNDLMQGYLRTLVMKSWSQAHRLTQPIFSIQEALTFIEHHIPAEGIRFDALIEKKWFSNNKDQILAWTIASFIGILELAKQQRLDLYQAEHFQSIFLSWMEVSDEA